MKLQTNKKTAELTNLCHPDLNQSNRFREQTLPISRPNKGHPDLQSFSTLFRGNISFLEIITE